MKRVTILLILVAGLFGFLAISVGPRPAMPGDGTQSRGLVVPTGNGWH